MHLQSALNLGCVLLLTVATLQAAEPFADGAKLPPLSGWPDPLVMLDGTPVTSKKMWREKRRPELKALFEHYMYGSGPPAPEKVTGKVEREDRKAFDGKATQREITLTFGPPACPKIHLLLVIPNDRKKPAPVFLGMNFCGNHALVKDPKVAIPTSWMYPNNPGVKNNRATEAGRGTQIDVWALEQSIDRGYA